MGTVQIIMKIVCRFQLNELPSFHIMKHTREARGKFLKKDKLGEIMSYARLFNLFTLNHPKESFKTL